ncbi:MAG TPA: ABC transporter substrate-binding protein [Sphingomonas bacterium]|jgi:iron complex transport system substrate-binding protein|uniref:ABC transporter substrate-binding protein n=1 Tax=Sphingomonas bacterium TaxID=1895847 RepID=A0A3D0WDB4_9SPHN|nr:ABC transporter substrate-binding protein [Sphingomonas bacterium]
MRRAAASLVLLLAAGCSRPAAVPGASAEPLRVMSVNQCTDQIVLALLPPERIASVSWLSRDPAGSLMASAAARVPVNHGQAEEVLAEAPDLVVAGSFTTPALRGMLKRIGWPMIEVDHASSFDDIRRTVRQVAAAVGEPARGEALIAGMDARLAEAARRSVDHPRVAAWDGSGFGAASGTLYDAVLTAAGARNVVREMGGYSYGRPDIETLLKLDPDLIVQGAAVRAGGSLGDEITNHRVVRERWKGRTLRIPQAYYVCGTPMIGEAVLRLQAEMAA